MNPSPKVRFREMGDSISRHKALLESRELERGLDFALLQYQVEVSSQIKEGNSAMAAGYRILGAQEFLSVFRTLTVVPLTPTPRAEDNLTFPPK